MHVEQRILHQRNTPQGNFTILPTEVADLPTETGPLAPGLEKLYTLETWNRKGAASFRNVIFCVLLKTLPRLFENSKFLDRN